MYRKNLKDFHEVNTWIFDFDDTLYPTSANMGGQIYSRMCSFISEKMKIDKQEANRLQKELYHKYGTTLHGLMILYDVAPHEFLDYVYDGVDTGLIKPEPALGAAISALTGKKYIFTNSIFSHVQNIAGQLGILELFNGVFDIRDGGYIPKPYKESYNAFLNHFDVQGKHAAIFDDLLCNLEVPNQMGMIAVLVKDYDETYSEDEVKCEETDECNEHIYHVTTNLTAFLKDVSSDEAATHVTE